MDPIAFNLMIGLGIGAVVFAVVWPVAHFFTNRMTRQEIARNEASLAVRQERPAAQSRQPAPPARPESKPAARPEPKGQAKTSPGDSTLSIATI
jgi:hypothetical protein